MRMFRDCIRTLGGAVILAAALSAQTFTTLYNLGSYSYDASDPSAPVIFGPRGELYGTTTAGGRSNLGTVYKLSPPASPGGAWAEVVLHSFDGPDGESPGAGLAMGPNGALYGVTPTSTDTEGTVFELDPPKGGSTHWTEIALYQFPSNSVTPPGALVFGAGQSLYGTTGTGSGGAVYSLTAPSAAGGGWTQTTLYSFVNGSGGWRPRGTLAGGTDGTLCGVTTYGGRINSLCRAGCGTVYSLTPPVVPGGAWTEKVLYGFAPQDGDGRNPSSGVVIAPGGVLYGTTTYGGGGSGSSGTVFSLTPPTVPGEPMTETILHAFNGPDGAAPAALVLGPEGVLYGTAVGGGTSGSGTVFKLTQPTSPGGRWALITVHSFTGQADGGSPNGLTWGSDGTLYGTTLYGGAFSHGTVFALTP